MASHVLIFKCVDAITEPMQTPTGAAYLSCAQKRLARVLTCTVQPNTAEMYSRDNFVYYIVNAAGQLAFDHPLYIPHNRRRA